MPEVLSRMSGRWNQLSPFTKFLAFAVSAILAFGMAAGIGAVAALMVSGNLSAPSGERAGPEGSSPAGELSKPAQPEQTETEVAQQQYADAKGRQAAPQDRQTTYVNEVGEIQTGSVDTFIDSHEMLLRYDTLTSGDVEKLQADQVILKRYADQAGALSAPQRYEEHKDVFRSAIDELHRAAQLAYVLAADPISATQDDFDHYDHLVNEAAAGLQRSNEILGKDYETIAEVRGVSASQKPGVLVWAKVLRV
jgi:hypothetical protein